MSVALMTGTMFSGSLCELVGRKMTLIACQLILASGWAIVYFAKDFPLLMVILDQL